MRTILFCYIGKNKHPEAESIYTMSKNVYLIEPKREIPNVDTNKSFCDKSNNDVDL